MTARLTGQILVLALSCGASGAAFGQATLSTTPPAREKAAMNTRVNGEFDVKLNPMAADGPEPSIQRLALDKQFRGGLEGTSKGQMLAVNTDIKNSAGYVAIERVTGTLSGRSGSFALQHNGIMTRGEGNLTISVVPDSGTGALTGLAGKMTITITGGKHLYDFEYEISAQP